MAEQTQAPEAPEAEETIAFTVDDEDNVLELIRSDAEGLFIREASDWTPVNMDEEQPTIDDQIWLDATPEAIMFWDGLVNESDRDLTREQVREYTVPSQ